MFFDYVPWSVLPTIYQGKLLKEGLFVAKLHCDITAQWRHYVIMTQNWVTASNLSKKYILYVNLDWYNINA